MFTLIGIIAPLILQNQFTNTLSILIKCNDSSSTLLLNCFLLYFSFFFTLYFHVTKRGFCTVIKIVKLYTHALVRSSMFFIRSYLQVFSSGHRSPPRTPPREPYRNNFWQSTPGRLAMVSLLCHRWEHAFMFRAIFLPHKQTLYFFRYVFHASCTPIVEISL